MNWPVATPLPEPCADPLPDPPAAPPEGEAHGSLGADPVEVEVAVGVAAVALGLAEVVGAVVAPLSARDALLRCARPFRMLSPPELLEEDEAVGGGADDAPAGGAEEDEAGASPLVRSHTRDCSEGSPPELGDVGVSEDVDEVVGVGEAGPLDPEPAATATVAGVSITAAAAADSPIVTRFMARLRIVAIFPIRFAYPP